MREWFKVEAAAKGKTAKTVGEILIYSYIGKRYRDENVVDARDFVQAFNGLLQSGKGDVHIRINSPGGDVAEGIAIYNAIRAAKDRVVCTIDSVAFSMASVIALAGRTTRMQDTGQYMVHSPRGGAWGTEADLEVGLKALRAAKAVLVKAYTAKTGKTAEEILALMEETTWVTAERAKELGFVDEIIEVPVLVMAGIAACFDAQAWVDFYTGAGPMPVEGNETGTAFGGLGMAPDGAETDKNVYPPLGGKKSEGGGVKGEKDLTAAGDAADELLDGGGGAPVVNRGESPEEVKHMSKLSTAEIEKACPGASAAFVLDQVKACEADENRTLVDVQAAHIAEQGKALAEANAAKAAAEKSAAEAVANAQRAAVPDGVPPLAAGGSEDEGAGGDPVASFEAAVQDRVTTFREPRHMAVRAVANAKPHLFEAFEAAHNLRHREFAGRHRTPVGRS